MASTREITDVLEERYPLELVSGAEPGGLLIGSADAQVLSVLCAVEPRAGALELAIRRGYQLIVSLGGRLPGPGGGSPWDTGTPEGAFAARALGAGVNVVACHGSVEAAAGGTADLMAERLGLEHAEPLLRSGTAFVAKVVVFVPHGALEDVSAAMARAGAGTTGEYRHCSFRVEGTGTFLPGEGAKPYSGTVGTLNFEREVRLEMTCPSYLVGRVAREMVEAHPYEEVAYDVYRTEAPVPWGLGRAGTLERERTCADILEDLAEWCGSEKAVLHGDPGRPVSRVALAPGDARLVAGPAFRAGCELLVAGELSGRVVAGLLDCGTSVVCLGDGESRAPMVPQVVDWLKAVSAERSMGIEVEGYEQRGYSGF